MNKMWDTPANCGAPPTGARVPACVRLGGVEIRPATVLAPMSGVSDMPYRRLAKRYGTGLVISEMIAGSGGLGYYIVQMQYALRPEPMYAAVISISAAGYLLNRLFVALERRWLPWVGR